MQAVATAVNRVGRVVGVEVRLTTPAVDPRQPRPGVAHGPVAPNATHSPWNLDDEFLATHAAVADHTLVDLYRGYQLWQLVAQAAKLPGPADLLEVGVWRGGTGALIARRAATLGLADTVHLCDTFTGVVKAGPNDPVYVGGEHSDTSEEVVRKLIGRLGLTNTRVLTGVFPDDTAGPIAGRAFRFCHVDVDVYQSAKDVFDWVWPRLVPGGVVVYDDYGFHGCEGVARHVDELRGLAGAVVVHNLTGQAVVVKAG